MDSVIRQVDWQTVPKTSLHCHLEGTIAAQTILELAAKNNVQLRAGVSAENLYSFSDFAGFILCFIDACHVLIEPSDYGRIAAEFVDYALAQNIRYAEVFVSPAAWRKVSPTLDITAALEAIAEAFTRAHAAGCTIRMLFDITRNFGPEIAATTVQWAIDAQHLGVIGIGIGGDERNYPAPAFAAAFAQARAAGLRCVAHAGEDAGPQSIHDAIALLQAERIGHGIAAVTDPELLTMLAERGIVLEQSPGSNERTGVWTTGPHPIGAIVAAGVRVAVDADDPAIFGTTITNELAKLARLYGPEFAFDRLADAIGGAFISEIERAELLAELTRYRAAHLGG